MELNYILNFCNNFKIDVLKDYRELIVLFNNFSKRIHEFSLEEQNLILNAFNCIFDRIEETIVEDTFLPNDSINEEIDASYYCPALNKEYNSLDEIVKTFISIRLLLPENLAGYENLELLDFKRK